MTGAGRPGIAALAAALALSACGVKAAPRPPASAGVEGATGPAPAAAPAAAGGSVGR